MAPGGLGLFHLSLMAGCLSHPIAARLPARVALEPVRIMEDPTLYAYCTGTP
jgi:hypothetical protein